MSGTFKGLELRSTIMASGELRINLAEVEVSEPGADEVIVRVEATPINPSDLLLLLGPIDPYSIGCSTSTDGPGLRAQVVADALASVQARIGQPLVPGNEGAGLVVAAGSAVRNLLGKRVGMRGGGMYTQYRKVPVRDCMILPEDATSADGASMFINPLTALCFIETMRMERHDALIHFAAASNLGQMLNRICIADTIPLINVVRNADHAAPLAGDGATCILDSSVPDFEARLTEAIAKTGATLCFDPIGGGRQASIALAAMEAAAAKGNSEYNRYGTDLFKQIYVYGLLDRTPTVLDRWVGFAWSVGGWLLTHRLRQVGPERAGALRQRVVDELKTTFRSSYTRTLTLREALSPDMARAYDRKATGEKYLITPHVD
jgi:NADPH:quinone reductase